VLERWSKSAVAIALLACAACVAPARDFTAVSTALHAASAEPTDAQGTPAAAPQWIDADADSDDDPDAVVVAATAGREDAQAARTSAMLSDVCTSVEHRSGLERPPRA
jgi:hypothetical protein